MGGGGGACAARAGCGGGRGLLVELSALARARRVGGEEAQQGDAGRARHDLADALRLPLRPAHKRTSEAGPPSRCCPGRHHGARSVSVQHSSRSTCVERRAPSFAGWSISERGIRDFVGLVVRGSAKEDDARTSGHDAARGMTRRGAGAAPVLLLLLSAAGAMAARALGDLRRCPRAQPRAHAAGAPRAAARAALRAPLTAAPPGSAGTCSPQISTLTSSRPSPSSSSPPRPRSPAGPARPTSAGTPAAARCAAPRRACPLAGAARCVHA